MEDTPQEAVSRRNHEIVAWLDEQLENNFTRPRAYAGESPSELASVVHSNRAFWGYITGNLQRLKNYHPFGAMFENKKYYNGNLGWESKVPDMDAMVVVLRAWCDSLTTPLEKLAAAGDP